MRYIKHKTLEYAKKDQISANDEKINIHKNFMLRFGTLFYTLMLL